MHTTIKLISNKSNVKHSSILCKKNLFIGTGGHVGRASLKPFGFRCMGHEVYTVWSVSDVWVLVCVVDGVVVSKFKGS